MVGDATPAPAPAQRRGARASFRHSWIKLRLHVYMCRKCGMGRVNARRPGGDWFTTFHKPDGVSVVALHVPPCVPGKTTAKRLARYLASS